MFCRLLTFSIVLSSFFLVFCALSVPTCSALSTAGAEVKAVNLFTPDEKETTEVLQPNGKGKIEGKEFTFKNITAPFLLAVDDVMVSVAERNYTDTKSAGNNEKVDLVAKYIKIGKDSGDWGKTLIEKFTSTKKWNTQLATQNANAAKGFSVVRAAVVSAKNKIYFFAVNNTQAGPGELSATPPQEFTVVEGTISSDSDIICWEKLDNRESLKAEFDVKFKDVTLWTSPSDGFAFVTAEKNVVFVVKGQRKSDKKSVTAFIQLKEDNSNTKEWKLLKVEIFEKCYPHFFSWGDKIMMIPTDCNNDRSQKVKELTDMKTWNDSSESFSRLWDVFQDKKGFTTANINNEKPILFTYNISASEELDTHLWISDSTRVADVGLIVTKDEGSFYGSILYTSKELFILYKKKATTDQTPDTQKAIVLKRLKDVINKITDVLNAWKSGDEAVTKLCTESATPKKYLCVRNFSTNGLVGFLSNKGDESKNIWEDKYLYVNADVKEGKKTTNGFTFSGLGSGAEWPVGKEMKYYLYNFAEYGFTLVATVTFDAVEKNIEQNSVMGVGINKNAKHIGLWCNKDKKWSVNNGESTSNMLASNKECTDRQRYQVALKLEKRKVSVHVDWDILNNEEEFTIGQSDSISHFYFGANIKKGGVGQTDESHVTVTNVLLYNRPFTADEINELKKNVKPAEVPKSHDDNDNNIPQGGDQQPPTPPPVPTGDEKEKKAPSPSRTEDGGVGGGVRVFSLLLAVLCVSAPLLHL